MGTRLKAQGVRQKSSGQGWGVRDQGIGRRG